MSGDIDAFVDELQLEIIGEVREQYSQTVLDHWMKPRNFRRLEEATGHARITGPCGDTMELFVRVQDDHVGEVAFLTDGCMTTIVSASMAVELATGRTVAEARAIRQVDILKALGGLPEESEHCAKLAAMTLAAALDDHRDEER
jgi:nitrogen fixation NifU-like protein